MKNLCKSASVVCIFLLGFTACKKDKDDEGVVKKGVYGPGIYVSGVESAGVGGRISMIWKNNVLLHTYGNGSTWETASGIYVSDDGNLYVSGYEQVNGRIKPKYWVNGEAFSLPSSYDAYPECIYQSPAGDLYVAGREYRPAPEPGVTLWKNGVPIAIDAGYVVGICVAGTDVYLNCLVKNNTTGLYQSVFWKDGVFVPLPAGAKSVVAAAVFFYTGTDQYRGTQEYPFGKPLSVITVYKNNIKVDELSDGSTNAKADETFVKNDTVYVVGDETSGPNGTVTYWSSKGTVRLTSGTKQAEGTGIFVK